MGPLPLGGIAAFPPLFFLAALAIPVIAAGTPANIASWPSVALKPKLDPAAWAAKTGSPAAAKVASGMQAGFAVAMRRFSSDSI